MSNKYREIEIDLTTVNDIDFVLDVVKNNPVLTEMFANEYDGSEHFSSVIYVNTENIEEFYANNEIFEHIGYDEYELDEDCVQTLNETKKATIDDMYELKKIFEKFDAMYERYSIVK